MVFLEISSFNRFSLFVHIKYTSNTAALFYAPFSDVTTPRITYTLIDATFFGMVCTKNNIQSVSGVDIRTL